MVLYRSGPHARLRWGDVWPAAVVAALFFEFGKNLLTYYLRNMGNYNALAGSLGAAILFLAFVYYASQVILFAAELAKHRLLVRAGTLPAIELKPAVPKAKVRPMAKVKGMLVRLWKVDQPHHDTELPYAPARLDPVTNRPTNTREEVLVKQGQAAVTAARDAGTGRAAVPPQDAGEAPAGEVPPRAGGRDAAGARVDAEARHWRNGAARTDRRRGQRR